jgi:hypothetical protein
VYLWTVTIFTFSGFKPPSNEGERKGQEVNDADTNELANKLKRSAVGLLMSLDEKPDVKTSQTIDSEGQAFLIETRQGSLPLATVKHNLCKDIDEEGNLQTLNFAKVKSLAVDCNFDFGGHVNQDFTERMEEDYFEPTNWKYGREVLLIDVQRDDILEEVSKGSLKTFQTVSPEFKIKDGMNVGILARSCCNLLAKSMEKCVGQDSYEAKRFDTFVTVGNITAVGDHHIEYKVNTVPGFSGGPVFLLDPGADHHMKVVAVHAGYSQSQDSNFGLLVAQDVETFAAV